MISIDKFSQLSVCMSVCVRLYLSGLGWTERFSAV